MQTSNVELSGYQQEKINAFLEANPDFNLSQFNFFKKDAIDQLDWSATTDKEALLNQLKGLQRLQHLTFDEATAANLYNQGLDSAYQITSMPQHQFIAGYADCFPANGISSEQQAKRVYQRALFRRSQAMQFYLAILQQTEPHYRGKKFDNYSQLTDSNYAGLPSYQDLFGVLDYCTCEQCRSIFSAAAYFVDLMSLQNDYIHLDEKDKAGNSTYPYKLKTRRPDLWNLTLSCENTNTKISELIIVNEILEKKYLQLTSTEQDAADQDILSPDELQNTVFAALTESIYPFNLPFDLPLLQINTYLTQYNTALSNIWLQLNKAAYLPTHNAALVELGLSAKQWALYSTPLTDPNLLCRYYGLTTALELESLIDVTVFLKQTGLNYQQLDRLLIEDLSDAEIEKSLNQAFFINVGTDAAIAIETVGETTQLTHLIPKTSDGKNNDYSRLDHINRFVRLALAIDWTFTDLDWALRVIAYSQGENVAVEINDKALGYLAWMQQLHNKRQLSINQCCALLYEIKDFGNAAGPMFFDSLFYAANVLNPPIWYTPDTMSFDLTWYVGKTDADSQQIQAALAAALMVSQQDLLTIAFAMLEQEALPDGALPLTLANLSSLYRVTLLSKLLNFPLYQCYILIAFFIEHVQLQTVAPQEEQHITWLAQLLTFSEWLNNSPFSLAELQYILTGRSYDLSVQNKILGNDSITNFLNNLRQVIDSTLLTDKAFFAVMNDILMQSEYSVDAVNKIYNKLLGNYIDSTTNAVTAVPDLTAMQSMIVTIFPKGTATDNSYVTGLSEDVISVLSESQKNGQALTIGLFTELLTTSFMRWMRADDLTDKLWAALQTDYVSLEGIVEQSGDQQELMTLVSGVIFPLAPSTLKKDITDLVASTLMAYCQNQQASLVSQLAGLYDIAGDCIPAIEIWDGLSFGDLTVDEAETNFASVNLYAAVPLLKLLLNSDDKDPNQPLPEQIARLQWMQRYAYMMLCLSLRAAEANSMVLHPSYYDLHCVEGKPTAPIFQFNVANLQNLCLFKSLLQTWQDDQNRFLTYLDTVASDHLTSEQACAPLAQLTNWNEAGLTFLAKQTWLTKADASDKANAKPDWGSVAGVWQLSQWFGYVDTLNMDLQGLWQLNALCFQTLSSSDNYVPNQNIANSLWGGLTHAYSQSESKSSRSDPLITLQNTVNQSMRDALLPIVIDLLDACYPQLSIKTPMDLYQYLLIDVEVSGVVETSRVVEANSAVQLYIYRCINNLEPSTEVQPELLQWWDWMQSYRVWQANREVFLYPENYMDPSLRTEVTPLFSELKNTLQQGNLNEKVVITQAYQNYLDNFALIANLKISGCASYNTIIDMDTSTKTLCFIACTYQQPYSYYYCIATYQQASGTTKDVPYTSRYIPVNWQPWLSIGTTLDAVGPVTPAFAFGKWFIFWVEQQESGTSDDGKTPYYTASLCYAYLNFNQEWSAKQVLASAISLPRAIAALSLDERGYWDRIYPVFVQSTQSITVSYGTTERDYYTYSLSQSTLDRDVIALFPYVSTNPPQQVNASLTHFYANDTMTYRYAMAFNNTLPAAIDLEIEVAAGSRIALCLCNDIMCIAWRDPDNHLHYAHMNAFDNTVIQKTLLLNCDSSYAPCLVAHNDKLYIGWTDANHHLNYGCIDFNNPTILSNVVTLKDDTSQDGPSLASFKGKLYIAWVANTSNQPLWYGYLDTTNTNNTTVQGKVNLMKAESLVTPVLAATSTNLYIAWQPQGMTELSYGYLDTTTTSEKNVQRVCTSIGLSNAFSPALTVVNDDLYVAWTDTRSQVHYGLLHPEKSPTFVVNYVATLAQVSDSAPGFSQCNNDYLVKGLDYYRYTGLFVTSCQAAASRALLQTQIDLHSPLFPLCLSLGTTATATAAKQIALCSFDGKIRVAWTDNANKLNYAYINSNNQLAGRVTFEDKSFYAPSLAVHDDQLYIGWTSTNSDRNLYYACINTTNNTLTNVTKLSTEKSANGPTLASFNGKLCMAYIGNGSPYYIYYGYIEGSTFKSRVRLANVMSEAAPALASTSQNLYLAWWPKSESEVAYGSLDTSDTGTSNTTEKNLQKVYTSTGFHNAFSPSLMAANDKLYLAWTDTNKMVNYGLLNTQTVEKFEINYVVNLHNNPSVSAPSIVYNTLLVNEVNYAGFFVSGIYLDSKEIAFVQAQLDNASESLAHYDPAVISFAAWFQIKVYATPMPVLAGAITMQADATGTQLTIEAGGKRYTSAIQSWQWNHVVLTSNQAGHYDIYYNGFIVISDISLLLPPDLLLFGSNGSGEQFLGEMQEVLYYNRNLMPDEIKAMYYNMLLTHQIPQLTQHSEMSIPVNQAFLNPAVQNVPIIGQPNWYVVMGEGAEIIVSAYATTIANYLDCYRLNSTAFFALSQALFFQGIPGLLTIPVQESAEVPLAALEPDTSYIASFPPDTIDFNGGLLSQYYWEIFFHAPFLIASSLQTQGYYQSAQNWYRYIFNPTVNEKTNTNDQYWNFLGLRSSYNSTLQSELDETWVQEIQDDLTNSAQLAVYHDDPFSPFAIAALRPIAYQKTLVMHYIDNLIQWADKLYTQYTIETLGEATMLYVEAYNLLGSEPVNVGACDLPPAMTLDEILTASGDSLQTLPEFLINVEPLQATTPMVQTSQNNPNNYIAGDYFGLPENSQLIGYWTTIQKRLYGIRHSLAITGVYTKTQLFQPPVDPMQLIQQIVAGNPINQALANLQMNVPYYRFDVMIAKAKEIIGTVIQLGQQFLSVLEKQDAEALTLLYNLNEQKILNLQLTVKEDEIDAAKSTVKALEYGLKSARDRYNFYTKLIDKGLSSNEKTQLNLDKSALAFATGAAGSRVIRAIAARLYLLPTIYGVANGGASPGDSMTEAATISDSITQMLTMSANLTGMVASYERRNQEWHIQQALAENEIEQANNQIAAAKYQQSAAEQDLTVLETNLKQQKNVAQVLKSKFTNQQLYQWMAGKVAAIYFQTYQLAYEFALQTQQAWQFEKATTQNFITGAYWDSLHQGLLAGEALLLDVQRMETTYMKQNVRRFEIQKTISLSADEFKQALATLKDTGSCNFSFTEKLFDADYPNHYSRQIKTISLSFPVVLGPYQNIHATLTQTSNTVVIKDDAATKNYLLTGQGGPSPDAIRVDMRANQQIALSQGVNDTGLFELNFSDPRYLPFEGTGAISSWTLSIPKVNNPNVLDKLTDVVIVLWYTALPGSEYVD